MKTETVSRLARTNLNIHISGKKKFSVADNFQIGKQNNGVSISWLGPNFKAYLLPIVETDIEAIDGSLYRLEKDFSGQSLFDQLRKGKGLSNRFILEELGDKKDLQINLYHFHEYLKKASHSHWHFSYLVDNWSVFANWNQGWIIGADRFDELREWQVDFFNYHLFSRDFLARAA